MILNQQRRVRVSIATLDKFLAAAQKRLRLPPASLTVALVSDPQMARWNAGTVAKIARPMYCPSQPMDPSPNPKPNPIRGRRKPYLGDIAIAPTVARRNALRFGRTFDQEMRILILHGVLHLMGYDHETDQGQMTRRENRLRRDLGLA